MDLPSSDQDSSKGPTLIPIVGKNIDRGGGESVFSNHKTFQFHIQVSICDLAEGNPCMYVTAM